jgi:hypothetical protein
MKTCLILSALGFALNAYAGSVSYTGTLPAPEDVFQQTFNLTTESNVRIETWGFGGGINAAGTVIPSGGFDPLVALFSGSGPSATILTDGSGDPLADSDTLANPPFSFVGNCPPAGTVAIGANNDCGDDLLQYTLSAGTYTLLLSDADYTPNAVYDDGTLSEGFTDFTGGVFQTCDTDGSCITPDGNYAVDIVSTSLAGSAPEPMTLPLLATGLAALAVLNQLRNRRETPHKKGDSL